MMIHTSSISISRVTQRPAQSMDVTLSSLSLHRHKTMTSKNKLYNVISMQVATHQHWIACVLMSLTSLTRRLFSLFLLPLVPITMHIPSTFTGTLFMLSMWAIQHKIQIRGFIEQHSSDIEHVKMGRLGAIPNDAHSLAGMEQDLPCLLMKLRLERTLS